METNNNNSNINTENMNIVGNGINSGNGENTHNCVMSSNGTFKQFTLTEDALRDIEMLREYEREGGSCEKFFFDAMKFANEALWNSEGPSKNKIITDFLSDAMYFNGILKSIANTKQRNF